MMTIQSAIKLLALEAAGLGLAIWAWLVVMLATWWVGGVRERLRGHGSWAVLVLMLAITIALACLWGAGMLTLFAHWQEVGR